MAFLFFGTLCILAIWRQKIVITCFFGGLSFLGMALLLLPGPLSPVYDGWLRIAHWVGRMTTLLILTLAYYVVITPSGLIKRLFGGRPLPFAPDRNAQSYWIKRTEPAQPRDRFYKRY